MTTTTVTTVQEQVYAALTELGIEAAELSPGTQLRADLDIDSAELVEIVAALAGGRAPDGKALKEVRTIAQLVEFLERR
ncbi:acyl carrier protein [Microbispora sp. NPDC049125]|uniref:acyl carrier protein n=1 Tax=Microbispora sp. NPDC049125 TaxID=3154929 RepID=UPI0034652D7F